jgi:hypothetical protein
MSAGTSATGREAELLEAACEGDNDAFRRLVEPHGAGVCGLWLGAEKEVYTPLSLDVLTLDGMRASAVTAFVTPCSGGPARQRFAADVFGRFGLPGLLD